MKKQAKIAKTIALLKMGYTTALESALRGGCHSLSQRVTLDIEPRYLVARKWVKTTGGSLVMAYRITGERA